MRYTLLFFLVGCGAETVPGRTLDKLSITWEDGHVPDWDQVETAYNLFKGEFGAIPKPWDVYFSTTLFVDVFGLTSPDDRYSEVLYDQRICRTAFLHELLHVWVLQLHKAPDGGADPFHDLPVWPQLVALEGETCGD